MSENQEKNATPQNTAQENPNQKNNGGRYHRHNRHRGQNHRHTNSAEQARQKQETTEQSLEAAANPEAEKSRPVNKQGTPNKENEKKRQHKGEEEKGGANKGGQKQDSQRNRNNQNRNRGRGPHERYQQESRLYDPYEAPNKEEIELSELRARIVMKAADGSVPTALGTTASPSQANDTKTHSTVEDTELPLSPAPETPTPLTADAKRIEIVGIRFRSVGKMYYFDPHDLKLTKGQCAIVETTRGPECGEVCLGNTLINEADAVLPLRPVIRVATPADIAKNEENRKKEKQAFSVFQEKAQAHKLQMKAIDVQYAFDGSKLLFYFSSDGRVDFRELVKDLASVFRTRIELRQIGIRDEAKMLGGIGACGRALCCSTFLPDFAQVSIKMAKDQNLSLNSTKISGVCGRLMCCLRFEEDVYVEEIRKTPGHDCTVKTPDGIGTVIGSNPLAGTVRVALKDTDSAPKQYHRDEVTILPKEKKTSGENKKDANT